MTNAQQRRKDSLPCTRAQLEVIASLGLTVNAGILTHGEARNIIRTNEPPPTPKVQRPSQSERVLTPAQVTYEAYLETPHWGRVRDAALKYAEYRCQVCYSPDRLTVHHRTYERRGHERQSDVIALCVSCHYLFHRKRKLKDPS